MKPCGLLIRPAILSPASRGKLLEDDPPAHRA